MIWVTRSDLSGKLEKNILHGLYSVLYRLDNNHTHKKVGSLKCIAFELNSIVKIVSTYKGNYRGSHISRNRELILNTLKEIRGEKEKNQAGLG